MKQLKKLLVSIFASSILFSFIGWSQSAAQTSTSVQTLQSTGNIYLYGEKHGDEKILKKEIEIWGDYYKNQGLRHLFLETPYYTAEFLNIWMHSETDEILDRIYDDWEGTANHNPVVKDFYLEIKARFPETVFHGTDVGHQYQTTGMRYLDYLSQQNKESSDHYQFAKEAIEQGKYFYEKWEAAYRENKMVANFNREFNSLKNKSIMGIYGSAHTGINSMDIGNSIPSMANQLQNLYALHRKQVQVFTQELISFIALK